MSPNVKPAREEERIRIQVLSSEGYGVKEICEKLKVSPKTVRLWREKNYFKDNKRPRRPTVLSPTTKRQIKSKMYRKLGSSTR